VHTAAQHQQLTSHALQMLKANPGLAGVPLFVASTAPEM